jgi:CRISPR-associated protein Cmr1
MANRGTVPSAPSYEELPPPHNRASRAGPLRSEFTVCLKTITPVLGGAVTPRTVDEVDVIRAPSVRGHLRFWWRALYGHQYATASELFAAESALWGRAAHEKGGRSAVEIGIRVFSRSDIDKTDVDDEDPGGYALWPARAPRGKKKADGAKPSPRWHPGVAFALSVAAPRDKEREVKNAIRAWVLFGGYGGRTRRGVGSLTVDGAAEEWLPSAASREAVAAIFGRDVFAREQARSTLPWLAGASLLTSQPDPDAIKAWTTALGWLRDFRQGHQGGQGERARKPDPSGGNRPSISNWPEADKVRHLTGKTRGHQPKHNATPAYPWAGFGLPIIGRFQKDGRDSRQLNEPDDFELRWRSSDGDHDRLASPLIVKAMPLANGTFAPIALWLNRKMPEGSMVYLKGVPGSEAPFDLLIAPGDKTRFKPLEGKKTLRDAFLDWLVATKRATEVVR